MTSKARGLANLGNAFDDGALGSRNKVINGAMVIDQRNAGAAVTAVNGAYTLDRWQTTLSASSTYSLQRNAGSVTPPVGFSNYLGVTSLSARTIIASDTFSIRQWVEGFNAADLAWGTANAKPAVLSFWVRSSLTGNFGGAIFNHDGSRSYPFLFAVSSANTWEYKTVSIEGDISGTWNTDNSANLAVAFSLGAGSDRTATAGVWSGAFKPSAIGAVNVVATSGATFYITGVQLEAGDTATPFEHRSFGQELALCERYFETCSGAGLAASTRVATVVAAWNYRTEKRSAPTITLSGGAVRFIYPGVSFLEVTTVAGAEVRKDGAKLEMPLSSGTIGANGISVVGDAEASYTGRFFASAEL